MKPAQLRNIRKILALMAGAACLVLSTYPFWEVAPSNALAGKVTPASRPQIKTTVTENHVPNLSLWKEEWVVEAEKDWSIRYDSSLSCLDVVAQKGLTLWYSRPFSGDCTIRYRVSAVSAGGTWDRCSDLNVFWMATDPSHPDSLFVASAFRQGVFGLYYSLSLYYFSIGGNNNTTTRFRKYDGNLKAFQEQKSRPGVLREYLDPQHLIVPNRWYLVELSVQNDLVTCTVDGVRWIEYRDPSPLHSGWFGLRTTENHLRFKDFAVVEVVR